MKVCIIHYWWMSNRGGESVCAALAELFADADIFLHVSALESSKLRVLKENQI